MKTLLSRKKVRRNSLRSRRLFQNNLRLILAGMIPVFCSFQSTQAVVSSWTAVQPASSEGCDVSLVVEASLAASSSVITYPDAPVVDFSSVSVRTDDLRRFKIALEKNNAAVSTFVPLSNAGLRLDAPVNATLIHEAPFSVLGSTASAEPIRANALGIGSFGNVSQVQEAVLPLDGNSDVISSSDTFLNLTAVPEPTTWGMIVTGIGVVLGSRRVRRSRTAR